MEELEKLRDRKRYELYKILRKQNKRRKLSYKVEEEYKLLKEIYSLNKQIKEKNGKKWIIKSSIYIRWNT